MLDLCLLGTGGMMPLPNRRLTSLMTRLNGSSLLIDCGEGTQVAIREKGWSFHSIDTICFTHYHADHISGLPGLLLSMGNADRREPVKLVGPKGLERVVGALRVIAPELPFQLELMELTEPTQSMSLNGYEIEAFKLNHNVLCYGYSLRVPRAGKFMVEKANENNVPQKLWSKLQKGETLDFEGKVFTPDMILGPDRKGIKVTYCTDTRPVPVIVEKASGSDLFICEGMYGEKDKGNKAREYKHMTFYEAASLAKEARVKELWLTHYSPSLAKKIFECTITAKDKRSTTLEFDPNE
ncbi:MAG: ribonuclease Z [Planctomycetia bacterium]|nr:ribonuclease Z [Planctomycetia bacterium]